MNKEIFDSIESIVGQNFLKYILNYDNTLNNNLKYEEVDFNRNQINVLIKINVLINQYKLIPSKRNEFSTIKMYLFNHGSSFNGMRKLCGGKIKIVKSENLLLNYLISKTIEYYPSLLITDEKLIIDHLDDNIEFQNSFLIPSEEILYMANLFKSDLSLSKLLTLQSDNNPFSIIEFEYENSDIVKCYLLEFVGKFILTSFKNCCFRLKYQLNDIIDDIINQYRNLEKCANNQLINFSYFIGVSGFRIEDSDEYNLFDHIIIRNINEEFNPCIKNTISIGSTDKHKQVILGSIIELKTSTISKGNTRSNVVERIINYEEVNKFVNIFNLSLIASLNTIYPAIKFKFYYNDKPINSCHINQFYEFQNVSSLSILSNSQLDLVKEWFKFLSEIDLKSIELTTQRLKSAIFNRNHPMDSILDAFISWESMFSSNIQTTKSVVNSIQIILMRANYIISKTKLNELYSLRSDIVHGNPNEHKLIKSKNPENPFQEKEEVKKQVIEIAIIVLKELVKDNELINKTPKERVEYLLNTTIITCPNCKIEKYV